jgi:hypothetical protein
MKKKGNLDRENKMNKRKELEQFGGTQGNDKWLCLFGVLSAGQ